MEMTPFQIEEARRLYAEGKCFSDVAYRVSCFGRPKVTKEQVRAVITVPRKSNLRGLDPAIRAEAVRLYVGELMTPVQIAERLGIAERTARTATEHVRRPRVYSKDVEATRRRRRRDAARLKRARLAAKNAKPIPVPDPVLIEVPGWVPDHLHEWYEATALRLGEEEAARLARMLKAGGSILIAAE